MSVTVSTATFRRRSRVSGCGNCKRRKQRIQAHLGRLRERSRLRSIRMAATVEPSLETRNGNFGVDQIDYSNPVQAGGSITVSITMFNGFFGAGVGFGPDGCGLGNPHCGAGPAIGGTCHEVFVAPAWTDGQTRGPKCLGGTEIGTNNSTDTFTFPAPAEGGQTVSVVAGYRLPQSGTERSTTLQIQVADDSGGGGDGGNGDGSDGDENGGGGQSCAFDADCRSGFVCQNGVCVPEEPEEGQSLLELLQENRLIAGGAGFALLGLVLAA